MATEPKKFAIPPGTPAVGCRACGARIQFVETDKGRRMPVNTDGTSHFATCSDPKRFRKRDRVNGGRP